LLKEIGIENIFYGTDYPARILETYQSHLKYRLNLTDKEMQMIKTNSPLNEYAR